MKKAEMLNLIYQINIDCNNERGYDCNILISNKDKQELIKRAKIKSQCNEDSTMMFWSNNINDYKIINITDNKNVIFWTYLLTLNTQNMTLEFTQNYIKNKLNY
jgi:hypothetical protein